MIWFDGTHLVGSDLNELHLFAQRIGLKRSWFQAHSQHPHYDITSERLRKLARDRGAIVVSTKKINDLAKTGQLCKSPAIAAYERRLYGAAEQCGLTSALRVILEANRGKKPSLIYHVTARDPQTKRFVRVDNS